MSWLTEQLGMDKKPWGGTLPKWEDYSGGITGTPTAPEFKFEDYYQWKPTKQYGQIQELVGKRLGGEYAKLTPEEVTTWGPLVQQMYGPTMQRGREQIGQQWSDMGRYFSGQHAGALGEYEARMGEEMMKEQMRLAREDIGRREAAIQQAMQMGLGMEQFGAGEAYKTSAQKLQAAQIQYQGLLTQFQAEAQAARDANNFTREQYFTDLAHQLQRQLAYEASPSDLDKWASVALPAVGTILAWPIGGAIGGAIGGGLKTPTPRTLPYTYGSV